MMLEFALGVLGAMASFACGVVVGRRGWFIRPASAEDIDSWRPFLKPGDVVLVKDELGAKCQITVGDLGISITPRGVACLHVNDDNPVFLRDVVKLVRKAGGESDVKEDLRPGPEDGRETEQEVRKAGENHAE